jgi:hypothetical protein
MLHLLAECDQYLAIYTFELRNNDFNLKGNTKGSDACSSISQKSLSLCTPFVRKDSRPGMQKKTPLEQLFPKLPNIYLS